MLSEGWAVKSVTHILGLRAFGSPEWLDTAQLRRFQWTGIVADGNVRTASSIAAGSQ